VINPQQPDSLYATISNSSGSRVFKTTDGGASWSDASSGLPKQTFVRSLQIDLQVPTTLYVGTVFGVYKSSDRGESWHSANSGLTATSIEALAADPRNPDVVYTSTAGTVLKSSDGGANWTPRLATGVGELAIDPRNPDTIYAGTWGRILKSADGGQSWSESWKDGNPVNAWLTALAIDPQDSDSVYAATQDFDECGSETLHKTVDGGATWAHLPFRNLGNSTACISTLAVDAQNAGTLYAAFQFGGVFKSTDGGVSWEAANAGLPTGRGTGVVALAMDSGTPATLYAAALQNFPDRSILSVFKSGDGATSWHPANSGLPSSLPNFEDCCYRPRLVIDAQDPTMLYLGASVGSEHRVFRSVDAGTNWTDSGFAVASTSWWFEGLATSSHGASTVYAGTQGSGVFAISFAP
jgi:photosystem II stability/assembly factor-like uncharacterized protein